MGQRASEKVIKTKANRGLFSYWVQSGLGYGDYSKLIMAVEAIQLCLSEMSVRKAVKKVSKKQKIKLKKLPRVYVTKIQILYL